LFLFRLFSLQELNSRNCGRPLFEAGMTGEQATRQGGNPSFPYVWEEMDTVFEVFEPFAPTISTTNIHHRKHYKTRKHGENSALTLLWAGKKDHWRMHHRYGFFSLFLIISHYFPFYPIISHFRLILERQAISFPPSRNRAA